MYLSEVFSFLRDEVAALKLLLASLRPGEGGEDGDGGMLDALNAAMATKADRTTADSLAQDLEALRDNRVVSLTETLEYDTAGNLQNVGARLNWEITSEISEQVTGRMELFDGTVLAGAVRLRQIRVRPDCDRLQGTARWQTCGGDHHFGAPG